MSDKITAAGGWCAPTELAYNFGDDHLMHDLIMAQLEATDVQAVRGGIAYQCGTSVTNMPKEADA